MNENTSMMIEEKPETVMRTPAKYFKNWRSNGQRLMKIWYEQPQSAEGDDQEGMPETVVPVVTGGSENGTCDHAESVEPVEFEAHSDMTERASENSADRYDTDKTESARKEYAQ